MEVCKKKLASAKRAKFFQVSAQSTEKMLKQHQKRFLNPNRLFLHTSILYLPPAPFLRFTYYTHITLHTFCPHPATRSQNTLCAAILVFSENAVTYFHTSRAVRGLQPFRAPFRVDKHTMLCYTVFTQVR